jgi:catechol 2,3-dioxygenase-like lactoylglutathione lyase family enzyme
VKPKNSLFILFVALVSVSIPAYAQAGESRPPIIGISHISVYSSDSAKTEAFYVHDLGGVKRGDPKNPKGVRYYFSPTQFVEVLPLPAEHTISRLDHVAFQTADAEGLKRYMAAHGIAVPATVEKGDDGSHWFDVQDPEGNKVEFVQPRRIRPQSIPRMQSAITLSTSGTWFMAVLLKIPSIAQFWASAPIGMAVIQTESPVGSHSRSRTELTGSST